jgi:hypothetical protein
MKKWFAVFGAAIGLSVIFIVVLPSGGGRWTDAVNPKGRDTTTDDGSDDPFLPKQQKLQARVEDVPYGCLTYGIDESTLSEVKGIVNVSFALLARWEENDLCEFPQPPPAIAALHEKRVYVVGFMYPLESGEHIGSFKLMRSTQTCCWGPAPDYNQFALVTMARGKTRFERITPVAVVGKFFVECKPRCGYIYRMEATHVEPAIKQDNITRVNESTLADKGIIELDFALVQKLEPQLDKYDTVKEWPETLLALEGKKVYAKGYIIVRLPPPAGSKREKLVVSKYPNPEDASLANSVFVRFAEDQEVPAMWATQTGVSGTLRIHRNWQTWRRSGIVMVDQARVGVPE